MGGPVAAGAAGVGGGVGAGVAAGAITGPVSAGTEAVLAPVGESGFSPVTAAIAAAFAC